MQVHQRTIAAFSSLFVVLILSSTHVVSARPYDDFPSPSQPFQEETTTLRIWWPDALYSEQAAAILENQFDSFRNAYVNVNLDIRYREYQATDGVRRLTLTRDVAPAALPDLTLMRREELTAALNNNLLQPVAGLLPASTMNDLSENILALGQIEGELYGLPYLLNLDHMLYTSDETETDPPTNFEDFLSESESVSILFPATPRDAISDLLLIQYLAAGGYLANEDNTPALNEEAMLTVLEFYHIALQSENLRDALLENLQYETPADYWPAILSSQATLALTDSNAYLHNRTRFSSNSSSGSPSVVEILPPLTADGQPFTLLDGWVWVLLTNDPARQTQARNFLMWMMNSDNLTDTAMALEMLPSQQRALRVISADRDLNILGDLLENAYFLPLDQRENEAAVLLQAAFESVLEGTEPSEAVTVAITSLGN